MINYKEWEASVPQAFTKDSLWKMTAYRLALFLGDVGWFDVSKLIRDKRTIEIAETTKTDTEGGGCLLSS